MLGSLARKLRALGFDATYYRKGDDQGLLRAARESGRIILTSDRGAAERAGRAGVPAILVSGEDDRARIRSVARGARETKVVLVGGDPLCSICGGELEALRRAEVRGAVPPSVEVKHREFYRCYSCGKLYWKGSHWKKLRSLARQLEES